MFAWLISSDIHLTNQKTKTFKHRYQNEAVNYKGQRTTIKTNKCEYTHYEKMFAWLTNFRCSYFREEPESPIISRTVACGCGRGTALSHITLGVIRRDLLSVLLKFEHVTCWRLMLRMSVQI